MENTKNEKIKYVKTYSNVLIKSKISFHQFLLFSLFAISFLLIALEFIILNDFQSKQLVKNNLTLYVVISMMMFQLFNIRTQFIFIKWEINKSENTRIIFVILHSLIALTSIILIIEQIFSPIIGALIYYAVIMCLITVDMIIYFIFRNKFVNQFRKIILLEICALVINSLIFEIFIFDSSIDSNQITIQDFFNKNNLTLVIILVETAIGYLLITKILEAKSSFYFAKYNNAFYSLMEVVHPLAILISIGYLWIDFSNPIIFSASTILAFIFLVSCILISVSILIYALKNKGSGVLVNLIFAFLLLIGALICAVSIMEMGSTFVQNGLVYFIVTIGLMVFNLIVSFCSYMAQTIEKQNSILSLIIGFIGKIFSFFLILQFLGWEYYILEFFAPIDIIIVTIWIAWSLFQFLYFLNKYIAILTRDKQKWF